MAKSNIGYVERDKESQINWADFGTKLSSAIETNAQNRETRKKNFITANQTWEQGLQKKIPRSSDESLNQQILKTLNKSLDRYYSDYNSFTNGDISESRWVQLRQNYQDGLTNYFGLMDDYAKMIEEKKKRQKDNDSQVYEMMEMSEIESFNDYRTWDTEWDENANMAFQKLDAEGNAITEYGAVPLSIARKGTGTYYDKFKTQKEVANTLSRIGNVTKAIRSGKVKSRQSILERPELERELDAVVSSDLNDDWDYLSLLEDMGIKFTIANNIKDVRNAKILQRDGFDAYSETGMYQQDKTIPINFIYDETQKRKIPVFEDKVKGDIKEYYKNLVLTQAGITETVLAKEPFNKAEADFYKQKKMDKNKLRLLYKAIKEGVENPTEANIQGIGAFSKASAGGQLIYNADGTFGFSSGSGSVSPISIDPDDKDKTMRTLLAQFGGSTLASEYFNKFKKEFGLPKEINKPSQNFGYTVTPSRKETSNEKLQDQLTTALEKYSGFNARAGNEEDEKISKRLRKNVINIQKQIDERAGKKKGRSFFAILADYNNTKGGTKKNNKGTTQAP